MKVIALGDIHGRNYWKEIVNSQDFDKLIFIGDYFDGKEDDDAEQKIINFLEICNLKKRQPEKVILLLGNHDYHYLDEVHERYSDFQEDFYQPINEVLQAAVNEGLLQVCIVYGNILFTHAGLTKTWCNENEIDLTDLENSINSKFKNNIEVFGYSAFYPHTEGISPLWVRPPQLISDKLDDFIQVVGHTKHPRIEEKNGIYFIDTLTFSKEYLLIDGNTTPSIIKF